MTGVGVAYGGAGDYCQANTTARDDTEHYQCTYFVFNIDL